MSCPKQDFMPSRAIEILPDQGGELTMPTEGYKHGVYRAENIEVPRLIATVSAEKMWSVFTDLIHCIQSDDVNVALETSRQCYPVETARYRHNIGLVTLESYLEDHEDLLVNDGHTAIAVWNSDLPAEVQWSNCKEFYLYGAEYFAEFMAAFERNGVYENKNVPNIAAEIRHRHHTIEDSQRAFHNLASEIGAFKESNDEDEEDPFGAASAY